MIELKESSQLYYCDSNGNWFSSKDGTEWPDEKCESYLYKHLTWDEFQSIVNPPKSNDELFTEEMNALNDRHYHDVLKATKSYNIAKARDGSTETEKVIASRDKIADIDAQYETDQLSIINKYYGD